MQDSKIGVPGDEVRNQFHINYAIRNNRFCFKCRNFQLESLVLFEEIPLVWHHRNTSRFWLGQHSTLCEGDTCWKEMAWPFTDVRTGWEVSLAAMRFLLLFALAGAAMYLTSDYW